MSFTFASCNEYGIVVSADRKLTGINADGERYTLSSNKCRKLFLSKQGFALTYAGSLSVNDKPVSVIISELWERSNITGRLIDVFAQFVGTMSRFGEEDLVFIAAGYENGVPKIYSATASQPRVKDMGVVAYSGEADLAEAVINVIPIVYDMMTLQDRIDFHRFINSNMAKYQYFSDQVQTVSEDCDIVAIGKFGVEFTNFSKYY